MVCSTFCVGMGRASSARRAPSRVAGLGVGCGACGDGIEATRTLAGPGVDDPLAVVVITTFDLDEHVYAALRGGAQDFLLKDAWPGILAQAVHAAANGDALIVEIASWAYETHRVRNVG
jgi:DNA-binding NarL/FixJ family response regulator